MTVPAAPASARGATLQHVCACVCNQWRGRAYLCASEQWRGCLGGRLNRAKPGKTGKTLNWLGQAHPVLEDIRLSWMFTNANVLIQKHSRGNKQNRVWPIICAHHSSPGQLAHKKDHHNSQGCSWCCMKYYPTFIREYQIEGECVGSVYLNNKLHCTSTLFLYVLQASNNFTAVSFIVVPWFGVELYSNLLCITFKISPFHYNVILIF